MADSLVIRWYGVLYLVAFALAWWLLPYFLRQRGLRLSFDDRLLLFTAGVVGVIVGGRVGYAVLYEPQYFAAHPLAIFALWQGGMSSHGGMVGALAGLAWASRRLHIPILALLDSLVVPASLGLAVGRLGNFINQELYGTMTTLPWGMHFSGAAGKRHPVQLYAVAKDLFLAGICWYAVRSRRTKTVGLPTALFLIGYSLLRFLLEFVREPEYPLWQVGSLSLTHGQLYSVPLLVVGVTLWWQVWRRSVSTTAESPT